jgi:hypothetical protein
MTQPAWVCRILEHVREKHTLAQLIRVPERPREPGSLFHRLDNAIYGRGQDGMTPCDATPYVADLPTAGDVDVILAFGPYESPTGEVWSIHSDGLAEFASRKPFMEATVRARGKVIARTTAMPEISYRRAMSRLGWRTAAMAAHALDNFRSLLDRPMSPMGPIGPIGPIGLIRHLVTGYVSRKIRDRFTHGQWSLAFSFDSDTIARLDFSRFHRVLPPRDRLWADPFVVANGPDRAWVFLEEMLYSEDRGVISVMEVRRDGTWLQPRRVLERPYHLSYPCVFRWNGGWYMVPETGGNRAIELYRCLDFPDRWELEKTLVPGINAVDTTVFEAHGRWWMYYATDSGDAAGFDRLWLHHADTPLGPWMPHRRNPLECDVIGGRPGGRPFLHDGKLVRAGQIGAPWYGHAIQLREIVTLTPDEWQERELRRIGPDWAADASGTHTLNADNGVMIIDSVRERWAL